MRREKRAHAVSRPDGHRGNGLGSIAGRSITKELMIRPALNLCSLKRFVCLTLNLFDRSIGDQALQLV